MAHFTKALIIASAALCSFGVANAQDQNVDAPADGTVKIDALTVPLSGLLSEEGQSYMKEVIVDKPFGVPLPDLAAERERSGRLMLDYFYAPMQKRYSVDIKEKNIGGVFTQIVTPIQGVAAINEDRVLINLHGGGFKTGERTASLVESTPLASLMGIKVVSVDYRMGPEFQFPAASEDVASVYRELLKDYDASKIGIYGCSAGGLLTAQSVAWFDREGLPQPAAVGVFCASLGTFFEGDSAAVTGALNGMVFKRPKADKSPDKPKGEDSIAQTERKMPKPRRSPFEYLENAELDDPLAYPVVSPELMAKFPPTLFISATRSFEFSAALNSHNKLNLAGAESEFYGWDGLNHGFIYNSDIPESREAYAIMTKFFETHLTK